MDKKELIAHYFLKALSKEAQKEFDYLMSTDTEFAKEVTFQKDLKAAIEKEEYDTVKQQLKDFEAEEHLGFNYKKWLVAATVVVLLGLSSFWYFSAIDTEKLYAENFKPYRNVVQPIVRGESNTDVKTKAFTAYETKKYTEALDYFDKMLKENPNETIAFYKANVLLKLNKTEEAISILKTNLKTPDSLDAKNTWYLALAELRLNNIKNAKDRLTQLINSEDTFKKSEAKKLLKILK
ncbi:tetratricopeptide repeat protein [Psychroserpens sp. MEBiC05023]